MLAENEGVVPMRE